MKTIYFVRHGETRFNRQHRHQYPETPLTELGRDQAYRAAQALTGKGIERIITSDYARAQETAHIIAESLHVPVETSPLLYEVRRPTFLWGKHHFSPRSLLFLCWYFLTALFSRHKWDNEETVRDFEDRLKDMLNMLADRPESTLAVVTHRGVMTGLGPRLRNSRSLLTLRTVIAFVNVYAVDNGEITQVTYDNGRWTIVGKNANVHLKGIGNREY